MNNFKLLTLEDKTLIDYYTDNNKISSYSYRFSSLYLWRNLCTPYYCIVNDSLIILKQEPDIGWYFMMPLNYNINNLENTISTLKNFSLSIPSCNFLLGDIENFFIDDLKHYTTFNLNINSYSNDFEYIYKTSNLINLPGDNYHKKKNHYNSFIKNYNVSAIDIPSDKVIKDCMKLLKKWCLKKLVLTPELQCEKAAIEDALLNINYLKLKFIALYCENELIGFSLGERVGDTAIIHTERCDSNFKGVYAYINKTFLEKNFSKTIWVNRQEDCGNIGLRQSKTSYYPSHMIEKSYIKI